MEDFIWHDGEKWHYTGPNAHRFFEKIINACASKAKTYPIVGDTLGLVLYPTGELIRLKVIPDSMNVRINDPLMIHDTTEPEIDV